MADDEQTHAENTDNDEAGPNAPGQLSRPEVMAPGGQSNPVQSAEPDGTGGAVTRGTSVSLVLSGAIGLGVSVVLFAVLRFALSDTDSVSLFFWRSPAIPFSTSLFFFWSLAILGLKVKEARRERQSFELELLPTETYQLITTREVQSTLREINSMPPARQNLLLVTRIRRALRQVRASGNSGEIADLLEYQAEMDAGAVDSSYAAVRIFIWSIPVLGFIGTVQGISSSIGGFGELVQSASDVEQIKAGLAPVTGGLAVAFETTLLALVYSIIVMFSATAMRREEDTVLSDIEDYCVENLLNKLSIGDDKLVADLNEAFTEAQHESLERQAEILESALGGMHQQQDQAFSRLETAFGDQQSRSMQELGEVFREMFADSNSQQGARFSELSQRLERGLRQLAESFDGSSQVATVAEDGLLSQTAQGDTTASDRLVAVLEQQTQQLTETRQSLESLATALNGLSTLEPFQAVLGNIQTALSALVPAIDELKKPRELRIVDSHISESGDAAD